MAQFGKADMGLIKATAGAEAVKYMDPNLAIGGAIAGTIDKQISGFKQNQQAAVDAAKEFEKDFDKAYKMPEKGVPADMMGVLNEELMKHKQIYANSYGNSTEAKVVRAKSISDWEAYLASFQNMIANRRASQNSKVHPAGWDPQSHAIAAQINNGGDDVVYSTRTVGGQPQIYMAVSKVGKKPVFKENENVNKRIEELQNLPQESMSSQLTSELNSLLTQKEQDKNEFDKKLKLWTELSGKKHFVTDPKSGETTYNPARYHIYGDSDFPMYGNVDKIDAVVLETYGRGMFGLTSDSDFERPISVANEKSKLKEAVAKEMDTYDEKMHLLFSDPSEDFGEINIGTEDNPNIVNNTFANMFIHEAAKTTDGQILNSTETSSATNMNDMYKDANGNPLVLEQKIDNQIVSYEYGSRDWVALPEEQREEMLERHLRGYDADGNHDPDANTDWALDKYTGFMANVKKEHKELLKRNHFESTNRYFNDGTGNNTHFNRTSDAMMAKREAYNTTMLDIAFPENMLGSSTLVDDLKKGGRIAEALKTEFKNAGVNKIEGQNLDWDFKKNGKLELNLQLDGEDSETTYKFDFTGANAREEYLILKEVLKEVSLSADLLEGNKIPNDINEWDEIRSRTEIYFPTVTEDEREVIEEQEATQRQFISNQQQLEELEATRGKVVKTDSYMGGIVYEFEDGSTVSSVDLEMTPINIEQ